eukprot:tig00000940_g5547.t1
MQAFAVVPPALAGVSRAPPGARTCAPTAFIGRRLRPAERRAAAAAIRFESSPRAEAAAPAETEAQKRELLRLIEADPHGNRSAILQARRPRPPAPRRASASERGRGRGAQAARRLERANPTARPAETAVELFDGNWELEWTSGERTSSARQKRSINDLSKKGGVLQPISGAAGGPRALQNVVEAFGVRLVLEGPWEVVGPETIRFTFESASVKAWFLPAVRFPLKDVGFGNVRHVYIDSDMRLGWGDGGGLAVYTKRAAEGREARRAGGGGAPPGRSASAGPGPRRAGPTAGPIRARDHALVLRFTCFRALYA